MKRKLVLSALTLALVLAFSQAASAADVGKSNVGPDKLFCQDPNWVPLAQKLSLSERQVQQLKEINLNTHRTTKDLKVKLLDAKFELRQLCIDGTDKAAIKSKVKEINDLKTQLHQARQQKWQKIQSILTQEQQAKLKDMKGFGHHHGNRPIPDNQ